MSAKKNEYMKMLDNIQENTKPLAEKMIIDLGYMESKIEEYKRLIDKDGLVVSMPQGNYSIDRENPAVKGFHQMIKSRDIVLKKLIDLMPDAKAEGVSKAGEALKGFIATGKK